MIEDCEHLPYALDTGDSTAAGSSVCAGGNGILRISVFLLFPGLMDDLGLDSDSNIPHHLGSTCSFLGARTKRTRFAVKRSLDL